jgi:purine-binding chemotaxis protein CheW
MGMMERVDTITGDERGCLSFRVGGEEYAVDILAVQEIRAYEKPTRIADAPPSVLGVIHLRGIIVPIIDLRLRLGFANPAYDVFTVVIILNVGGRMSGVVVDAVSDVLHLRPEEIRAAPALEGTPAARFILGLASIEDRLLVLVDIEKMVVLTAVDGA